MEERGSESSHQKRRQPVTFPLCSRGRRGGKEKACVNDAACAVLPRSLSDFHVRAGKTVGDGGEKRCVSG